MIAPLRIIKIVVGGEEVVVGIIRKSHRMDYRNLKLEKLKVIVNLSPVTEVGTTGKRKETKIDQVLYIPHDRDLAGKIEKIGIGKGTIEMVINYKDYVLLKTTSQ